MLWWQTSENLVPLTVTLIHLAELLDVAVSKFSPTKEIKRAAPVSTTYYLQETLTMDVSYDPWLSPSCRSRYNDMANDFHPSTQPQTYIHPWGRQISSELSTAIGRICIASVRFMFCSGSQCMYLSYMLVGSAYLTPNI